MTELYLVRHGESLSNAGHSLTGQLDVGLSEKGFIQAECVCKYFKNIKIDAFYSSDLKRACDTIKSTAYFHNKEITPLKELREIYGGVWEGMNFAQISEEYPNEFEQWKNNPIEAVLPDGESTYALANRVYNAICEIAEKNDEKKVVISTHSTPLRTFLSKITTGDFKEMKKIEGLNNGSISKIIYENKIFSITDYAYTGHLSSDLLTALPGSF